VAVAVSQWSSTQGKLGDRLRVTTRARAVVRRFVAEQGCQHIILSWPAGATTIPAELHMPGGHDVVIGHVARCPIYADMRQLALYRDQRVLLDVPDQPRAGRRPLLRLGCA
jgi:uncharacterized protein (DUF779 family)